MITELCTYTMRSPQDIPTMLSVLETCKPFFAKHDMKFLGTWTSARMLGRNFNNVYYMLQFDSYAQLEQQWAALRADKEWTDAEREVTKGDFSFLANPDHITMGSLPFSPDTFSKINEDAGGAPMLYEMREYEAPHSGAMQTNIDIAEISLPHFEQHGCEVVGLWSTSQHIGPDSNKLNYLLRFRDLAHLESGWADMRGDKEWFGKFMEICGGDMSFIRRMGNYTLAPAPFSPLK